jgi:hypothetical protein
MNLRATKSSSISMAPLSSNAPNSDEKDSALMERRKALKEGAFVRYSNADMLEKLRAASPSISSNSSKSPMKRREAENRLTKSTSGLPGNLYLSRAASALTTFQHDSFSMPYPTRTECTMLLRETMDGIGHAAILNHKTQRPPATPESAERLPPLITSKSIPVIELETRGRDEHQRAAGSHHHFSSSSYRQARHDDDGLHDEGLTVLLQSTHWKKSQRASKLIPLVSGSQDSASSPGQTAALLPESAAEAIALVTQEALDAQRDKVQQMKLQKEREAVDDLLQNTGQKPGLLDDDSLNLWQGKRLTGAEMKVEQRLHVLRNNPGANKDLKMKVLGYIDEKHQEHQERQALAEFAIERRELKTIQFLSRRFKNSPKKNQESSNNNSPPPAALDLFHSAYDPSTGEPRIDMMPLPHSSMSYWSGLTKLTSKIEILRELIAWRHETKRICRFKVLASVMIQKYWRGHKARQAIRNLRAEIDRLNRENEQKQKMLAEGDAAQKVLAFLQHMECMRESGMNTVQAEVSGRLSRSARTMSSKRTTTDLLRRIRLGEHLSVCGITAML